MDIYSDHMSWDNKLELFVEFLETDEWIFPIQSFIDYYCVIFATDAPLEHLEEKSRVYEQYKNTVSTNMNEFLSSVLGITRQDLP